MDYGFFQKAVIALVLLGACHLPQAWADYHYAAQNGQTPGGNYTSWDTAASNIQEAVDKATTNDIVLIGAGRYILPPSSTNYWGSNIVFLNKPMILRSSNSVPESTIIDGEGKYRGVFCWYQWTTTNLFVIDGLTVSNCHGTNVGGGVVFYPHNSAQVGLINSVLKNCVIVNNSAGGQWAGGIGGGVYGNQGSAAHPAYLISNCVVKFNRALYGATNAMGSAGGGIYLGYGTGTIVNCSIISNWATSGGGIYLARYHDIINCSIIGNLSTNGRDRAPNASIYEPQGAAVCSSLLVRLRNCLIANNVSYMSSGGVKITGGTASEMHNCTVVDNYSGGVGGNYGGTVYLNGGSLQVVNSIVVSNTPYHARNSVEGAGSYITNSCLIPTNFGSANPVTMLITNHPQFAAHSEANYRLTPGSPCVNSGLNLPWIAGALDLDNHSRLDRFSGTVDMGCYEYVPRGIMFKVR